MTGYIRVEAYATSNKKAVVLEFGIPESAWRRRSEIAANGSRGPVYILSPNDPEGFAAELRRLPGVGGIEGRTAITTRQPRPAANTRAAAPAKPTPAEPTPTEPTPTDPAATVNLTPSQRKAKRR